VSHQDAQKPIVGANRKQLKFMAQSLPLAAAQKQMFLGHSTLIPYSPQLVRQREETRRNG
jgi:hypothetical protein